ncbi:hypothetical protein SDC9_110780 [bioreactor metagenome]|uniref:Uncharacterized protein n=1 Tax=bioreactor metagenome TaxID=1076179 RepID=A0A645BFI5_9ZZZZ
MSLLKAFFYRKVDFFKGCFGCRYEFSGMLEKFPRKLPVKLFHIREIDSEASLVRVFVCQLKDFIPVIIFKESL